MSGVKVGRGAEQVSLRLPDGMRDRIRAKAEENGRSLNAELIWALNTMYPPEVSFDEMAEELKGVLKEIGGPPNYGHDPFHKLRSVLVDIKGALEAMHDAARHAHENREPDYD